MIERPLESRPPVGLGSPRLLLCFVGSTRGLVVRIVAPTRNACIRTLAGLPIEVELRRVRARPRYQLIAERAVWLRGLGYPDSLIALCIGVTDKTVAKAIRWFNGRSSAG